MSGERILVVEDEAIVAMDIKSQLRSLGYNPVAHASRGEDAVALARQLLPDLVLMDIQLAGAMDGITAAQIMRNELHLAVVFLSAFSADDILARAKQAEPFGYVLKPFAERELRTALEMALYKKDADLRLARSEALNRSILDSVSDQIAVINHTGVIIAVNQAWRDFSQSNTPANTLPVPASGLGINYLDVCRNSTAPDRGSDGLPTHEGIHAVLQGTLPRYTLEYPCHAPQEQRWFQMNVTPLLPRGQGAVICHTNITARKLSERYLQDHQQQLKLLSKSVLDAQENERRRVAHELHDELGQALTAVKINLQTSDNFASSGTTPRNQENIRIVDEALQHVRRMALALRPSVLDDLGLNSALEWLAEQTSARGQVKVRFNSSMGLARVAPEVETACFRIVQESLTNIQRHAQATQVEIHLDCKNQLLHLVIKDNGQGFDVPLVRARARAGKSMGLLGMEERALLVGARMDLESTPGQGCTVRLSCPLGEPQISAP
jgi:signal transduction histidine kinase